MLIINTDYIPSIAEISWLCRSIAECYAHEKNQWYQQFIFSYRCWWNGWNGGSSLAEYHWMSEIIPFSHELMWVKETWPSHLGMVPKPSIRMVMTGGWLISWKNYHIGENFRCVGSMTYKIIQDVEMVNHRFLIVLNTNISPKYHWGMWLTRISSNENHWWVHDHHTKIIITKIRCFRVLKPSVQSLNSRSLFQMRHSRRSQAER